MRESKAPAPRVQRILVPVAPHRPDLLELSAVVIHVDGQAVTLGDYWVAVRMQAAAARLERGA